MAEGKGGDDGGARERVEQLLEYCSSMDFQSSVEGFMKENAHLFSGHRTGDEYSMEMSSIHGAYLALYDRQMAGFYDKYSRSEKDVYRDVREVLDSLAPTSL